MFNNDIFSEIFLFIDPEDLIEYSYVNSVFRKMINNYNLWHNVINYVFNINIDRQNNYIIKFKKLDLLNNFLINYDTKLNNGLFYNKKIKHITIDFNTNLSYFPSEIVNLVNLEILEIGMKELKYLPPELNKLSKLDNLYIRSYELRWLSNIENEKLNHKCLPPELYKLTKIRKYYICGDGWVLVN